MYANMHRQGTIVLQGGEKMSKKKKKSSGKAPRNDCSVHRYVNDSGVSLSTTSINYKVIQDKTNTISINCIYSSG